MGNPLNENSSGIDGGFGVTLALLRRSLTVGVILFVLPPTGELPYRWQAAVAFLVLTAWCYVHGVFARRNVQMAALEAVPTLWLSLKCTEILVFVTRLAA